MKNNGIIMALAKQVVSSADGTMTFCPTGVTRADMEALNRFLNESNVKFLPEFNSITGICYRLDVTPMLREKAQVALNSQERTGK